jgi:signal transduction histidine kinase
MNSRSIARRLIVAVLLLELLAALILVGLAVEHESHARFHAFDVMLHGRADSLLGAVGDAEDAEDHLLLDTTGISVPPGDLFDVVDDAEAGRLVGRSPGWPAEELKTAEADKNGLLHVKLHGRDYRFVRVRGVRVVDPGDKAGGVTRQVTVLYGAPTEQVWKEVREAVRFYAWASVLLLTLTGCVMAWFLRQGLAPLRELADAAGRVSAQQWRFTPPESARVTRELAPLARAIESALARLQQTFKQQERFTSDAAHELKTDVAIVKSSLQLLAMRTRSVDEYKHGLEVCLQDCVRLESTVQEMLTLAGMQYASDHKNVALPATSDLAVHARETIARFSSLAKVREIHPKLITGDCTRVKLDGKECMLLCSNLLHNAIQHSLTGSAVRMELRCDGGSLRMVVEDFGEGIAPEILPHVFEPFFRGDESRDRSTGGTGLGLAICRSICDKAGGSIEIVSTVGAGTSVIVHLPLADGAPK